MGGGRIGDRIKALNRVLVGQAATYEGERGKQSKLVVGVVVAVEFAGCQITNERGSFMGVRLCIKPKGKRPVWTWPLADEWGDLTGERERLCPSCRQSAVIGEDLRCDQCRKDQR